MKTSMCNRATQAARVPSLFIERECRRIDVQALEGTEPRAVGSRAAGPWRSAGASLLGLSLLAALASMPPVALAGTTIFVNTLDQEINDDADCSLQEAIYAANRDANTAPDPTNLSLNITTGCPAGSGHDIIELPPLGVFQFTLPINDADNYIGPTVTPIITSDITIEGRGARLQRLEAGSRLTRAFAVGASGFLDLREVHLKDFAIQGGNGGLGGGGGGMGAGGAIYVEGGALLVQWSTFEGNGVRGGDGGDEEFSQAGGGGGGLSGSGGDADFSGGGGGGSRGDGGNGSWGSFDVTAHGGGGGGRVTSGMSDTAGQPCGAAGGVSDILGGDDGDSASPFCPGGGGGGGTLETIDLTQPGDGGQGSYGGGGGGGGIAAFASGDGGDGGFGAGGGGAADNDGGDGGFGGGGGQGNESFGSGNGQAGEGHFSGDASSRAGGGGAGLGGAIFGHLADIHVVNCTFFANSAQRGLSGTACGLEFCARAANDGRGAGGAIFLAGGTLVVESSTFSGNATREYNDTPNGPTGLGGGAIVVYDPSGSQEATLKLRNNILASNGPFECYTRNGVDTGGSDGNIITDPRDNSNKNDDDDDTPCPGVSGSDDPGLGQLQINPPGRTPTMAIGPTSPAINVAVGAVPLDDQRGILRPQGIAGDIGAYELEIPEPVPPVTTIALTPSTPNGSNGWYKTAVGVTITASDLDDQVAQTRCALDPDPPVPGSFDDLPADACDLTSVGSDGNHAIYAASRDMAGNTESPVVSASLKLDATAPSLAPSLNVMTVAVGQTGVIASPNASDATSGVANQSCGVVETSTPGAHSVSCTATDNAGNMATRTLSYVVEYRILGFFSPVPNSKWKLKQSIPIKIALGDAAGNRIADAAGASLAASCRVTFSATGAQPKPAQCMKYDPATDQFVFTWKLDKTGTGPATIAVSVSYPGSSTVTRLSEGIVITP
jgi:hypothetical protein